MRAQMQNLNLQMHTCRKMFSCLRTNLQMCKCANVQICKCAKNRRAQNAQICSANYFPNAEITNLHCAQKHKCNFLHMSQFLKCRIHKCTKLFLYMKVFSVHNYFFFTRNHKIFLNTFIKLSILKINYFTKKIIYKL